MRIKIAFAPVIACLAGASAAWAEEAAFSNALRAFEAYANNIEITTKPITNLSEDPAAWAARQGNALEFLGAVRDGKLDQNAQGGLLAFQKANSQNIMFTKDNKPLSYVPSLNQSAPFGFCLNTIAQPGQHWPAALQMTDREFSPNFSQATSIARQNNLKKENVCIKNTDQGISYPFKITDKSGTATVISRKSNPAIELTGQGLSYGFGSKPAQTGGLEIVSGVLNVKPFIETAIDGFDGWGTVSLYFGDFPLNGEEIHEEDGIAIYPNTPEKNDCSGVIVSPRHVLTAAHCVCHSTGVKWKARAFEIMGNNTNLNVSVFRFGELDLVNTFRNRNRKLTSSSEICGKNGGDAFFEQPDLALYRLNDGVFDTRRIAKIHIGALPVDGEYRASGYGANPYKGIDKKSLLSGTKQTVRMGVDEGACNLEPKKEHRACNPAFEVALSNPLRMEGERPVKVASADQTFGLSELTYRQTLDADKSHRACASAIDCGGRAAIPFGCHDTTDDSQTGAASR